MTKYIHGKLGENNLTDSEMFDLCYEILLPSRTWLSSTEISRILKSDYGKDIPNRRITMRLGSDPRFAKDYTMYKYDGSRCSIVLWGVRTGAKNVLREAATWK